ncbi:heparinase II/III-like protein [Bacillus sp. BK006]|nr:heparinase II/III-like protein [Bacillus sp. BK006]
MQLLQNKKIKGTINALKIFLYNIRGVLMNNKDNLLESQDILVVHSKVSNPNKLQEIYQDYKNQVYLVSGRYSKVHLTDEDLWVSEIHDRSWLFWHHCLVSVAFLIDSYYVDKNKDKLLLAYEIVNKWFKSNYPSSPSVMGWHDHSTALRLLHLTKLYILLKQQGEFRITSHLNFICEEHMKKLADAKFYMPKHNHGMDQDICLFIAASVLNHNSYSKKFKNLAIKRFWKQINNLFSEDGCYLEHSPHYIYLLIDRLLGFCNVLLKIDRDHGKKLQKRIDNIIRFFINILLPDGRFPTIGDSELQSFEMKQDYWKYLSQDLQEILQTIKGYNYNPINLPVDTFYPDGGYSIFRNNWNNDSTTTQIVFYSAFHSRVHKHHDDLAFTLYGHGMPLLIDGGKFTYEYDRPERNYVTSAYGHNTVRINNTETDLSRININKSGILSFLATKNIGYASGFHALSKNVTHRRLLFYLKPGELIVLDLIKGGSNTNTELIFNLNSELISEMKNNKIIAYHQDEPVLYLQSLLGKTDFTKHRGETNPLKGWSSPTYGKFDENDLLVQNKKGAVIKYATYIGLDLEETLGAFTWNKDIIHFKWRNFDVKVHLKDFHEHIFINNKHYTTTKKFNNIELLETLTKNEIDYFKSSF